MGFIPITFSDGQKKLFRDAQTLNTDLVEISYIAACCPICGKYRGRIFSISGKDKRFPKLPDDFHEDCGLMAFPFVYGVNEPQFCKSKDIIGYNNRPFRDTRTAEEKANYKLILQEQEEERQRQQDKIDYDWLLVHLPEICPKSFGAYRRMKKSESPGYQKIITEAKRKGYHFKDKGSMSMYCKNCGQQIPDNASFCPNCGTSQQQSQPVQQPVTPRTTPQPPRPPHQPPVTNYNNPTQAAQQNQKWYQKTPIIILLLIFFFPVGLFLMWKYSKWNKVVKIVVTVCFAVFALISIFSEGETDNPDTVPDTTSTTKVTETTVVTTTTAEDKDVSALTSISNLTADEAKEILKDLKSVGFDHIDNAVINGSQSNADSGASFTVSYNGYSAILIVIERKTDYISSGDITLFENGKAIDNINNYTFSSSEKGEFIYYAKEYVKQSLKAPSTAEFPGTVLEIGEWKVSRNKDVVTVQSYVDSQNGFGAMIRSNFVVQISYTDHSCLYMEVDGTVVYGKPQ